MLFYFGDIGDHCCDGDAGELGEVDPAECSAQRGDNGLTPSP